jgi:hypothetical protein
MMKFLKLLGILFVILGFYGNKADQFPFVSEIIDRENGRALKALMLLNDKGILNAGDPGFYELTEFLREQLNPPDVAKQLVFEKLEKTKNVVIAQTMSNGDVYSGPTFNIFLRGQPSFDGDTIQAQEKSLRKALKNPLLRFSLAIFWLGIGLNLFLVLYESKTRKKEKDLKGEFAIPVPILEKGVDEIR